MVYALYKSGRAVRDISQRTKVSRSTVSKIVREPASYGLDNKPLSRQGVSEEV
jgi:transposase